MTSDLGGEAEGGGREPEQCRVLGVDYWQVRLAGGGDLFLTGFGLPFAEQLDPRHWFGAAWFDTHRQRLRGTSTIYRSQTEPWRGRSLDLVVRFNRVGEDLPVDTVTMREFTHAEFNSPFEEVAVLMKLRGVRWGAGGRYIPTKRPLAIYCPPERLAFWQTGRSADRMAVKQARMPEMRLETERQYLLLYGWIKGIDVQEFAAQVGGEDGRRLTVEAMREVQEELREAGFRVLDMKPAHIIVRRAPDGGLKRRRDGRLVYALIDYELLEAVG